MVKGWSYLCEEVQMHKRTFIQEIIVDNSCFAFRYPIHFHKEVHDMCKILGHIIMSINKIYGVFAIRQTARFHVQKIFFAH